ncbi:MAG: hypothetical protein KDA54_15040 [Phycisphaerales bacterium]|nr:hypothetical protein [Phycisphaerales bacterium]
MVVLNNGVIVVTRGGKCFCDEEGNLVVSKIETVVLSTKTARETEDEPFAFLSVEDALIEIEWFLTDGADGVLTATTNQGLIPQLEFDHEDPDSGTGSSCSADCPGGLCNQSCGANKACIAYCGGPTAVCSCVKKPEQREAEHDFEMHELEQNAW